MKFLLPRSLFGRMVLILLTGLIMAESLCLAIHRYERSQMMIRSSSMLAAERIADIVKPLDSIDPAMRKTFLDVFRETNWLVTVEEKSVEFTPSGWVDDTDNQILRSNLNELLGERYPFRLMVNETINGAFLVQVRLHDGARTAIQFRLPDESAAWPSRMLLQLIILAISVLGISLIAVRLLTRPLLRLANAAEELGNDIHRAPLDERGPIEVSRAAHAFNTMQARLVSYIRDRTRLLAAISHDLKTPITRLRLRTELLDDSILRAKFEADLNDMESMIITTMEFMRGAEQQEALQPVDIMALLESLQADAQEAKHEVSIQGAALSPYPGRPVALKRCLSNLIDNAIKYGKSAMIQVEDNVNQLTVVIRDEGPGIPEDQQEQVFEPFFRLEESRSRASGGMGLGLSIARNIAQAHGGSLLLKNASGGGLEAILTLPRDQKKLSSIRNAL